jgi:hypothetical protein
VPANQQQLYIPKLFRPGEVGSLAKEGVDVAAQDAS